MSLFLSKNAIGRADDGKVGHFCVEKTVGLSNFVIVQADDGKVGYSAAASSEAFVSA